MKINKSKNKHDYYIDQLVQKLSTQQGIKSIEKNVEYLLGEVDIYIIYDNETEEYIEVKSNFHKKSYAKAENQLLRWTGHKWYLNKNGIYLGTYWTPQFEKPMAKNGRLVN